MNLGINSLPRGFQELLAWLVPIGAGFDWWGDEADIPGYRNGKFTFYIPAHGQDIEQSVHPRLYAKWCKAGVHKYGAGSTPTSTKAPDKRGRVSVGKDDMGGTAASRVTSGASGIAGNTLGAAGGAETVATTTAQTAGHAHTIDIWVQGNGGGAGTFAQAGSGTAGTSTVGSGSAHQNMQPSIVCNYIIRAG